MLMVAREGSGSPGWDQRWPRGVVKCLLHKLEDPIPSIHVKTRGGYIPVTPTGHDCYL